MLSSNCTDSTVKWDNLQLLMSVCRDFQLQAAVTYLRIEENYTNSDGMNKRTSEWQILDILTACVKWYLTNWRLLTPSFKTVNHVVTPTAQLRTTKENQTWHLQQQQNNNQHNTHWWQQWSNQWLIDGATTHQLTSIEFNLYINPFHLLYYRRRFRRRRRLLYVT